MYLTNVNLGTKLNWLDFEVRRLKVKVMPTPIMASKVTSGVLTVTGSKLGVTDSHSGEGTLLILWRIISFIVL